MVSLILSIIYWCKPTNKKLGIAALAFSILGFIVDLILVGWLAVIDLGLVAADAIVLYKHKDVY